MLEMWSRIVSTYKDYIGSGMLAGLFLAAAIYLFVTEKNKNTRILFVYMPVLTLILFFCPLFAAIVYSFTGEEIYYRQLWLLPVVPVLAYTAVKILMKCSGKRRVLAGAAMVGIFLLSGRLVYKSPYFSPAENLYHVPQTVVEICDTIQSEETLVKAVFPGEFLQYVRQYNSRIWMPYGREILVARWGFQYDLFELMEAQIPDAELIAEEARNQRCQYIIFSESKPLSGSFTDYGYELLTSIGGYGVYWDPDLDWNPWYQ